MADEKEIPVKELEDGSILAAVQQDEDPFKDEEKGEESEEKEESDGEEAEDSADEEEEQVS